MAVDLGIEQPVGKRGAEQQMIDAQAGIAAIGVPEIVPEGVDDLARVQRAQRVGPALIQQTEIGRPYLGCE